VGHGQVVGGGIDIDMAEISRTCGRSRCTFLAFPVPANQSPDCKKYVGNAISAISGSMPAWIIAESAE